MSRSLSRNAMPSFWLLQVLGWSAFGIVWYLASIPEYQYLEASTPVAITRVAFYISLGFVLSLTLRPIYRWLWRRAVPFPRLVLTAVACSLLAGILWETVYEVFQWPLDEPAFWGKPWTRYLRSFVSTAFVMLAWSALYFGIKNWYLAQRQKERALRAEALAHQAQLQMLRYQLNPHFFFNALNSIRALVDEDPPRARQMITAFADFIRYTLLDENHRPTTLHDELDVIRAYLEIEQIRFEDRLDVTYDVDEAAASVPLPPFLVHPLVENAIKHGTMTPSRPLALKLKAHRRNGTLRIAVSNRGALPSDPTALTRGVGLQSVRRRLEQVFPGRHRFDVFERRGWVHAIIAVDTTDLT